MKKLLLALFALVSLNVVAEGPNSPNYSPDYDPNFASYKASPNRSSTDRDRNILSYR